MKEGHLAPYLDAAVYAYEPSENGKEKVVSVSILNHFFILFLKVFCILTFMTPIYVERTN